MDNGVGGGECEGPFPEELPIGPKAHVCWCCLPARFRKWWRAGELQGDSKGNPVITGLCPSHGGFPWVPHTTLQDVRLIWCFPWAWDRGARAGWDCAHAPSQNKGQLLCHVDEGKQFGQNPLLLSMMLSLGVLGEGDTEEVYPRPELWQQFWLLLLFLAEMTESVKAKYFLEAKSEHFK